MAGYPSEDDTGTICLSFDFGRNALDFRRQIPGPLHVFEIGAAGSRLRLTSPDSMSVSICRDRCRFSIT